MKYIKEFFKRIEKLDNVMYCREDLKTLHFYFYEDHLSESDIKILEEICIQNNLKYEIDMLEEKVIITL
jgi:hypothetical protein